MVSPDSGAAIAYARTPRHITGTQRERITEIVTTAVPDALVTGWSQALATLSAWASRELLVFGSAVSLVILLILSVVYRDVRSWLLHMIALLAAATEPSQR
jgi:hypothetical protein